MKGLTVMLWATWKFALTFPFAVYVMQMSFGEVILYANIGGILGVLFFTYLSAIVIQLWKKYLAPKLNIRQKPKRVFSKRSRMMVNIKSKYGLIGIVILNPVLISIPVSAFLVAKYYGRHKINVLWLIVGQFVWSIIYTYFFIYIKQNINY